MSSASDQFFLRKFSFQSFFYGYCRVSRTGYTHCLIYISTSGKRVTDCTAKAGSSTTEWLDLSWMIVCLVLEVDEPLFFFSIYVYRNNDTAGIDLVGFFLVSQFSFGFKFFHCHKSKIHQADKFVVTAFIENFSVSKIFFVCFYDWFFVVTFIKLHVCEFCREGCVTAVIGPVGIEYTDLCHGRITFFFVFEVVLDMLEIFECHCKIQGVIQGFEICLRHFFKSVKDFNIFRFREYGNKCFRFFKACLTGIYRVDAVMFDCFEFFICDVSFDHICCSRANDRLGISIKELYALNCGVRSLVKLSRKIFY